MQSLPSKGDTSLTEFVPGTSADALDLMYKMLHFNPDKRPAVEEVLQQPYLGQLHCPEDEPVREPLDTSEFEFERRKIDMQALRQEIYLEALSYYPGKCQEFHEEQKGAGKIYDIEVYRLLNPGESQYSDEEDSAK